MYSMEELCDVREHINRQKYPERYTLVNSFINQRLNESVSHDSNNEKSRPLFPMMPDSQPGALNNHQFYIRFSAVCYIIILVLCLLIVYMTSFTSPFFLALIALSGCVTTALFSSPKNAALALLVVTVIIFSLLMFLMAPLYF
jgi:hypothetical protein